MQRIRNYLGKPNGYYVGLWSDDDVMPRLNTDIYIKCLEEVVLPWVKSMPGNKTPFHISRRNSHSCQKISATTSPLTSGQLTP